MSEAAIQKGQRLMAGKIPTNKTRVKLVQAGRG